jgi:hypothetical protein
MGRHFRAIIKSHIGQETLIALNEPAVYQSVPKFHGGLSFDGDYFIVKLPLPATTNLTNKTMKRISVSVTLLAMIFTVQVASSQDLQEVMDQFSGAGADVKCQPSYKFDSYIQMEVSDIDQDGVKKTLYDSYVNKGNRNYAMVFTEAGSRSTIVFDTENHAMLMLSENDGQKMGFVMGLNPASMDEPDEEYADESNENPYEPFKTGKTKSILGYTCDEYAVSEGSTEIRMWASEQLGKEVRKEMFSNQQAFGAAFMYAAYLNGMVLEYNFRDEENGEKIVMQVIKIELNKGHTISTDGYTMMSMGPAY